MFMRTEIFKELIFVAIFEVYVRFPSSLRSSILRSLKSPDANPPAWGAPVPPTHSPSSPVYPDFSSYCRGGIVLFFYGCSWFDCVISLLAGPLGVDFAFQADPPTLKHLDFALAGARLWEIKV